MSCFATTHFLKVIAFLFWQTFSECHFRIHRRSGSFLADGWTYLFGRGVFWEARLTSDIAARCWLVLCGVLCSASFLELVYFVFRNSGHLVACAEYAWCGGRCGSGHLARCVSNAGQCDSGRHRCLTSGLSRTRACATSFNYRSHLLQVPST